MPFRTKVYPCTSLTTRSLLTESIRNRCRLVATILTVCLTMPWIQLLVSRSDREIHANRLPPTKVFLQNSILCKIIRLNPITSKIYKRNLSNTQNEVLQAPPKFKLLLVGIHRWRQKELNHTVRAICNKLSKNQFKKTHLPLSRNNSEPNRPSSLRINSSIKRTFWSSSIVMRSTKS